MPEIGIEIGIAISIPIPILTHLALQQLVERRISG